MTDDQQKPSQDAPSYDLLDRMDLALQKSFTADMLADERKRFEQEWTGDANGMVRHRYKRLLSAIDKQIIVMRRSEGTLPLEYDPQDETASVPSLEEVRKTNRARLDDAIIPDHIQIPIFDISHLDGSPVYELIPGQTYLGAFSDEPFVYRGGNQQNRTDAENGGK